jgi:long-subunit fatty acid transport protein
VIALWLAAFFHGIGAASASPLETSSGAAVFTGPAHPHALSIYLNPAALGLTYPGQHLFLGTGVRLDQFRIQRRTVDAATGDVFTGATVKDVTFSPDLSAAFYTSIADRGYFGVLFHTPFWQQFVNRNAVGYHVLGGSFWQTLLSIAGSYRASSRFHFGLGLSIGISSLRFSFQRDTALEAGSAGARGINSDCGGVLCGHENPAAAQTIDVDVRTEGLRDLFSAENLALSAGVIIRPVGDWWVGISYVSPPGVIARLNIAGDAVVTQAPRDGGAVIKGRSEVTLQMPQSVHVGVRGPIFAGFDLVSGVRWQNYSRQDDFDIRLFGTDFQTAVDIPEWYPRYRGFADTWRGELGLESGEGARVRLGGRLRFETGATSSRRITPLEVSPLSFGTALGSEFRLSETLVLTAGYDLAWYPDVHAAVSDFDPHKRLDCVDSNFQFDFCEGVRLGSAIPTASGDYRRFGHTFSLSIRYDQL